ncbi:YgfZ/GcvT domain-containing protein [Thermogutta sp.]|uniref:CAF17-like 4Fe-4S cluster assembly/insertion protein YgfZ n=1 Tax=Thermogutta sp. TaxID=1962930 RepID=UPI003C7E7337
MTSDGFDRHVEIIARAVRELPSCLAIEHWHQAEILVAGPDADDFLHRVSTAPLRGLPSGVGRRMLFLDAKGHVKAAATGWKRGDGWILETESAQSERLVQHLEWFHIRERLEIQDSSQHWRKILLVGKDAEFAVRGIAKSQLQFSDNSAGLAETRLDLGWSKTQDPRAVSSPANFALEREAEAWARRFDQRLAPSLQLVLPRSHETYVSSLLRTAACVVSQNECEWLRILFGMWIYGQDVTEERLGPEVTDDERIIGLNKGCYPGQEVVARIVSRGHINWRLRGLSFPAGTHFAAGSEILVGGKRAGWLTSVAPLPGTDWAVGLGYIRREFDMYGQTLLTDAGPVGLHPVPFRLEGSG